MKTLKFILIGSIALGLTSCGESVHKHDESENHKHHDNENQEHVHEDGLHLNDDEKWIANEETHIGMLKMKEILNEFKTQESEDFKTLADSLAAQTNFIIQHCDMTGEPHNQLHFVLHPILDEIEALKNDKETITALEKLLNDYFRYFEIKE